MLKPNQLTIDLLKDLLADAEAGKIQDIAGVATCENLHKTCEFRTPGTKKYVYLWIGLLRSQQMYFEHLLDVCTNCENGLGCEVEQT